MTQDKAVQSNKAKKRRLEGVVVAKSGIKTVKVEVNRKVQHPVYKKQFTKTNRYLAHDPSDSTEVGVQVMIEECRPMSKSKRWIVLSESQIQA